ncbi:MAG: HNH endonuclease [Butyrivibrio sp.]|uniref:HNH endonuclease n=1 Tax=Butyrivibrio sp. TaxID=28121 RepID=UPI001B64E561|nr:HNH endonuclease signature motif containing protein [Butyrivibrio sp.]MBP3784566.1 HNH endonuclease [Butyrivibrio sp.]
MGTQLWNREARSVEDRKRILAKSNGRCARCGKKLDLSTMTIDHYIPFSRGGPDDFKNLVPLCECCNQEKKDIMVNPFDYYKCLPKEEALKLYVLQEKYSDNVRWCSPKNFTKEDSIVIHYSSANNIFEGHKTKNYCIGKPMKAVMKKCVYSDLDAVLEFTEKYHKKVGLPTGDIKEIIMDLFQNGALYKVVKCDNIVGIIPFGIGTIKKGNAKSYVFKIHGLPCIYHKPENRELIIKAIKCIMQDIALLHPQKAIMLIIEVAKNDSFGNSIARAFSSACTNPEEDDFLVYSVMSIFESDEERRERLEDGEEAARSFFDKIEEGYSDFISTTFRMRSADKYGKEKKPKQPKKREKRRREYDEYDIEYYQSN